MPVRVATTELRWNPNSGTNVIISINRGKSLEQLRRVNPRDWSKFNQKFVTGENCPFCVGHEEMTPPEVKAFRDVGSQPNGPGWSVRAIPNLGPALNQSHPEVLLEPRQVGHYLATVGYGYHYVVVETIAHVTHLADICQKNMQGIVQMWRDMTHMITGDGSVKYVAIFENYGPEAGASQPHCHSQILGMPVIPPKIRNELRGAENYFAENKVCVYCQIVTDELLMGDRIVEESPNFVALCPFTSETPYKVVITPKRHQSYFANMSTHSSSDHLSEFAKILQSVLRRIKITLNDPDYNLFIHTAPSNQPEMPYYHWHCEILPVTTAIQAGFEKGFGIYINPRSPEAAAADLRECFEK